MIKRVSAGSREDTPPAVLPGLGVAVGFRSEFLDFERGIHVGNLQDNERITRILKLALEARYGQPFVTERWGRETPPVAPKMVFALRRDTQIRLRESLLKILSAVATLWSMLLRFQRLEQRRAQSGGGGGEPRPHPGGRSGRQQQAQGKHWRSEEHTSELQSLRHLVC